MSSKNKVIQAIENEQMGKELPSFAPGDTIVVQVKVKEGTRERLQAFEGVVIAKRNRGLNSAFTVRKISHGVGVERTFQTYSPLVDSLEVKRRGDVRQAKLYYLRERSGKSARIKESWRKRRFPRACPVLDVRLEHALCPDTGPRHRFAGRGFVYVPVSLRGR